MQGHTVKELRSGIINMCALLSNEKVKCWGGNVAGNLGLGDTQERGDDLGEMGSRLPVIDFGTVRTRTRVLYMHQMLLTQSQ